MAIANLERLGYWYPDTARAALRVDRLCLGGGLTIVRGSSGGGKSTLLRLLNGLVPHFHGGRITGRVEVLGNDVLTTPTHRLAQQVGFVFQDPERQFVHGSVLREVAFGLENRGVPSAEMDGRIEAALAAVGIAGLRRRRIGTLSGGERQRVAIAAALALGPRLLVLDEPTSQLDPEGAAAVVASLAALLASGHDLVVSEHRPRGLEEIATAALRIEGGWVERGDPRDPALDAAAPSRRKAGSGGGPAWSMAGVSAGPAGEPVVERVNLEGRKGQVVVLQGPNGGGKSTLLRVLAGLLPALAGTVEREPGRVAYLPQDPAALLHLPTVRAEVELTLGRAGDREAPEVILGALGLIALADRYPRDLSSGERQRAAIAATLAGSPAIALLDEPTRGMDEASRDALGDLVVRLAENGSSIVIATHDEALGSRLADRVVEIRDGTAS